MVVPLITAVAGVASAGLKVAGAFSAASGANQQSEGAMVQAEGYMQQAKGNRRQAKAQLAVERLKKRQFMLEIRRKRLAAVREALIQQAQTRATAANQGASQADSAVRGSVYDATRDRARTNLELKQAKTLGQRIFKQNAQYYKGAIDIAKGQKTVAKGAGIIARGGGQIAQGQGISALGDSIGGAAGAIGRLGGLIGDR